jgi:hypothetical protein
MQQSKSLQNPKRSKWFDFIIQNKIKPHFQNPPVVLKNQPSVVVSQHTVDVRSTPPVIPETTTKRPTQRPTQRPTTIRVIGSDNVLDVRPSLVTPLDQIYEFVEVDEVKEVSFETSGHYTQKMGASLSMAYQKN